MWFTAIKGAYPSLGQIDRTLPVTGATAIQRGSLVVAEEDGGNAFFRAGKADDAETVATQAYIALQGSTDSQGGMAGGIGTGARVTGNKAPDHLPELESRGVKITAISLRQPMEFQTDMFDADDYDIGDILTVGEDGLFAKRDDATTQIGVAQVTKAPFTRWVNNAVDIAGFRTGANVSVIQAETRFLAPTPVDSDGGDGGTD